MDTSQALEVNQFNLSKLTPQQLQIIKANVAKNATDDELKWFLYQASALNLNPLTKEIWFIKYQGGDCIIITSRDGFLKKAAENPEFVGVQSMEVREKDDFKMGVDETGTMQVFRHVWQGADRGNIVGAWACVTYKDGSRDWNYVNFKEYATERNPVWKSNPTAMIKKCAESPLLRKAGKMNGVYLPEEIEKDQVDQSGSSPEGREKALALLTKKVQDATTMAEFLKAGEEISKVSKGLLTEEINALREIAKKKKEEIEKGVPVVPAASLTPEKKADLNNLANGLKLKKGSKKEKIPEFPLDAAGNLKNYDSIAATK